MTLHIKRNLVAPLINRHKGKIFSVSFKKKDGTLREMTCQVREVMDHLGINPIKHLPQYITVTEVDPAGKVLFKNINTQTMETLSIAGNIYRVID